MIAAVFIEPHERFEAIDAYRDRLTPEQIDAIQDADDGALIQLQFGIGSAETRITIIEEG